MIEQIINQRLFNIFIKQAISKSVKYNVNGQIYYVYENFFEGRIMLRSNDLHAILSTSNDDTYIVKNKYIYVLNLFLFYRVINLSII